MRIHNYLNKKDQISSPIPQYGSAYAKERGKESGEFVEGILFGDYKSKMTLKQILFILDRNNYSVYHNEFRTNFEIKSNNVDLNTISDELKNIMNLFEIDVDDKEIQSEQLYTVGKYMKGEIIIEFPPQHSMEKLNKFYDN